MDFSICKLHSHRAIMPTLLLVTKLHPCKPCTIFPFLHTNIRLQHMVAGNPMADQLHKNQIRILFSKKCAQSRDLAGAPAE